MESTEQKTYKEEVRITGKPVSPGIVIGCASVITRSKPMVEPVKVDNEKAEIGYREFEKACNEIVADLEELKKVASKADMKEILNAQIEIAKDPEIAYQIKELVLSQNYSVDYAVYEAYRNFIELIQTTQNTTLMDRITDIAEIRDQMIRLIRKSSKEATIRNNSILVANELSASELVRYVEYNIKGLAIDGGGETSHTSIIARSMGIPAIIGMQNATNIVHTGEEVILDGSQGLMVVAPGQQTLKTFEKKQRDEALLLEKLESTLLQPSQTLSGSSFRLCANIEFETELPGIQKYAAEGIGLLRTESLYLTRGHFEDQATQEKFYEKIVSSCPGMPVTIRLFDAGGDKFAEDELQEHNPFLGWRGIRILLAERNLLRDQLTAILTVAGKYPGQVRILLPMIASLEELMEVKEEISAIQDQLNDQGTAIDEHVPLGIMVEVPSVAVMADDFAPHIDFLSIGTNDLTQYTLAVDRGNKLVTHLYNQTHPAIWRMVKMTLEAGKNHSIPVTVCGELASNPVAAACLLGLGITDLSMAPIHIPKVKKMLISHTSDQMKKLSQNVVHATTQKEINNYFKEFNYQ